MIRKYRSELFCMAKNQWKCMRPEVSTLLSYNSHTCSYVKNKVDNEAKKLCKDVTHQISLVPSYATLNQHTKQASQVHHKTDPE